MTTPELTGRVRIQLDDKESLCPWCLPEHHELSWRLDRLPGMTISVADCSGCGAIWWYREADDSGDSEEETEMEFAEWLKQNKATWLSRPKLKPRCPQCHGNDSVVYMRGDAVTGSAYACRYCGSIWG